MKSTISELNLAWPGVQECCPTALNYHMSKYGILTVRPARNPVRREETLEYRTRSCRLIPRILHWHSMWKDSIAFHVA